MCWGSGCLAFSTYLFLSLLKFLSCEFTLTYPFILLCIPSYCYVFLHIPTYSFILLRIPSYSYVFLYTPTYSFILLCIPLYSYIFLHPSCIIICYIFLLVFVQEPHFSEWLRHMLSVALDLLFPQLVPRLVWKLCICKLPLLTTSKIWLGSGHSLRYTNRHLYFRSLAAEWARYGMRFNCIEPGPFHTKVCLKSLS